MDKKILMGLFWIYFTTPISSCYLKAIYYGEGTGATSL